MKTMLLIALSAILLTGCVSQSDYDNLKNENDKLNEEISRLSVSNNDLEIRISSLNEKIESLEAELKKSENGSGEENSAVTALPNESTIANNMYYDKDGGTISYNLDRDENNRLSLLIEYDLDIDTASTDHELKHAMCAGTIISTFKPYVMETESLYSVSVFTKDHKYDYCNMFIVSSKSLPIFSAKERDGTVVSTNPTWINGIESYLTEENADAVLWITETIEQINREISVYF